MVNMHITPETIHNIRNLDFHSRRGFLRVAAGLAVTGLLAGCGGDGGSTTGAATPLATDTSATALASSTDASTLSTEAAKLNLALNLEYLGAEFYAYASSGAGLPANLISGIGKQGSVSGGRQASFSDALVGQQASDLAKDKLANVTSLRAQLTSASAALPALDFSSTAKSAFSTAAQAAGIVGAGGSFDAFASDDNFLIGAFFVENVVAATYRTILPDIVTPAMVQVVTANLADAIYHNGLIRTMLTTRAAGDAALTPMVTAISAYLARLDGSGGGDQGLESTGDSSNIIDGDGTPIPFKRTSAQVLQTLYLTSVPSSAGGFLPNGANGLGA
jgi:hypothetical protein